jgi:hypothetical protein
MGLRSGRRKKGALEGTREKINLFTRRGMNEPSAK